MADYISIECLFYSYMTEITITLDLLHVYVQFVVACDAYRRLNIFPDKPHSEF